MAKQEDKTPVRLDLTDEEWLQLLDGMSEDSQLQTCCANISALRDEFVHIVRNGRNEIISPWAVQNLKQKLGWAADGHALTPLLKKVCMQLGYDPAAQDEHIPDEIEM